MALDVDSIDLKGLEPVISVLANSSREQVALLVGKKVGKKAIAYYMFKVENLSKSPSEFEGDPWQVVQAHVSAEKYKLEVIGVFHTHPICPAVPSSKDIDGMKRWPHVWVISCKNETRAWKLSDDVPVELSVTI